MVERRSKIPIQGTLSKKDMDQLPHACDFSGCGKRFSRPWKLEAHRCLHRDEKHHVCHEPGCSKAYTKRQHLRRHLKTFHQTQLESQKKIRCQVPGCGHSAKNENLLKKHASTRHSDKSFTCEYCSRSFKKNQQLRIHLHEHTGVKPFKCDVCEKSFLLPSRLKRHQKIHEGYHCSDDDCTENFATWSDLQAHKRACHKKSYTCADCNASFKSKGNLRNHVLLHLENREKFMCPVDNCNRSYFRETELKVHYSHVHLGIRDTCPFEGCGKSFSCKARLRRHARIHDPNYVPKAKTPRKYQNKTTRKDRGETKPPRKSMLSLLTGLELSYSDNQKLINNQFVRLSVSEWSGSDTDRSL